jgi:type IV pilus assembly protein PilP
MIKRSFVASILILLSGCVQEQSNLDGYISQVKARPPGRVEPLPEFKPYETFVYAASGKRSPFEAPISAAELLSGNGTEPSSIQPPTDHIRQPLEYIAIADLKMIGHIDKSGRRWALLRQDNGSVYRVTVGDYIGKNYGRITAITPISIDLLEIVPNGPRAWLERPRTVSLTAQ